MRTIGSNILFHHDPDIILNTTDTYPKGEYLINYYKLNKKLMHAKIFV